MKAVIVAAYNPETRAIENHGKVLRYFSEPSRGARLSREDYPVIIGGKTARTLLDHNSGLIPERTNIVVSSTLREWFKPQRNLRNLPPEGLNDKTAAGYFAREHNMAPLGVVVVPTIERALAYVEGTNGEKGISEKVFIAGGTSRYGETMSLADRLEITEVHKPITGDKFFPEIDPRIWYRLYGETKADKIVDEKTGEETLEMYTFVTYIKRSALSNPSTWDKQD